MRALAGRRILVTGAEEKGDRLGRLLREQGAEVIEVPLIRFEDPDSWQPLHAALDRLACFRHLIFTSATAVDRFLTKLEQITGSSSLPPTLEITTVGPKTAQALERRGITPRHIASDFRAEGIVALFAGRDLAGEEILFPRAQAARELLVEELSARGARITLVPVYRTAAAQHCAERLVAELGARRIDAVTFTSASAVREFARLLGAFDLPALLRDVTVACLGPVTGEAARHAGWPTPLMPVRSTLEDLAAALAAHYAGGTRRP